MIDSPGISVILPVFNSASTIRKAVESILNQSYKNFELLIIDDGSTDNLGEIIKTIYDERIFYHIIEHCGLGGAINYGLSIAKHDLIARMDGDDIAHPLRFEKQLNYLKENPETDIISCHYAVFEKNKIAYMVRPSVDHNKIKKNLLLYSDIIHSGVLYKKTIFEEKNPFPNHPFEDYYVWLKNKEKFRFAIIPEILMYVRSTPSSYSRYNILEKYKLHYSIQEAYYNEDEISKFNLDATEKLYYRGFREYFYGDKKLARKYWSKLGFRLFIKPKVLTAYLFTYLNVNLLTRFKEARMKLRLVYLVKYFSADSRKARKMFQYSINNNNENS